jgi:hypothetical protein
MTKFPVAAATMLALTLLSGCGRKEPIGDVPSGEELERQASAAAEAVAKEAERNQQPATAAIAFVNDVRGYTLNLPAGWERVDDSAAKAQGAAKTAGDSTAGADQTGTDSADSTVKDVGTNNDRVRFLHVASGALLDLRWDANRDDAAFAAMVQRPAGADPSFTIDAGESEIKRSGPIDDDGFIVGRTLKKSDGSVIIAELSGSADNSDALIALAKPVFDALILQ